MPFVGAQLGFSFLGYNENIVLTSTNGAAVNFTGNSVSYGIKLGTYYLITEKLKAFIDFSYMGASGSVKVSQTSDAISYPIGTSGGNLDLTHVGLDLGMGFGF